MPNFSSFTINDREATPVAHTFVPATLVGGLATYVESNGVPLGEPKLTVSSRKANSKYRISLRLAMPVVATETINGVDNPKVIRTSYIEMNLTFEETSTLQERMNAVGIFANMLSASVTQIDSVLTDLEGLW